jgi:glycosyltransferase involved in cell wall biosynthesis
VLPNGIHPGDWVPRTTRADNQPITIVSVMRTAPRKRPLQLLRILSAARRQVPHTQPVRAILIGSGPLDRVISRQIARSELNAWVIQAGRLSRPDIRAVLEAADIDLAPAKLESFGIAALEARCAGLPVIGMACGGLSDFIRHGTEGFLVHSDEAMAAHLAHLLKDPVLLRLMQQHNRTTSPLITWHSVLESHRIAYLRAGATGLTDVRWRPKLPNSTSPDWPLTPARRRAGAGVGRVTV